MSSTEEYVYALVFALAMLSGTLTATLLKAHAQTIPVLAYMACALAILGITSILIVQEANGIRLNNKKCFPVRRLGLVLGGAHGK